MSKRAKVDFLEQVKKIPDGKQELLEKLYSKMSHKVGGHSGRVKYSTRAYMAKSLLDEVI